MSYIQVKDLKKTSEVWNRLEKERELIITKDGRPQAIMIGIAPEELETSMYEIRRALFSAAVSRIRDRTENSSETDTLINKIIKTSREART